MGRNSREVHVGVYEKTRRYEVPKGTKCASIVKDFNPRVISDREQAEKIARRTVEEAFAKQFGTPPPDQIEWTICHLTFQVVVEMRWVE